MFPGKKSVKAVTNTVRNMQVIGLIIFCMFETWFYSGDETTTVLVAATAQYVYTSEKTITAGISQSGKANE